MDEYVEYSEEGWFSRIGSSIKNVFGGFVLILLAFPCIFWNECRSVDRALLLEQGAGAVVKGDANNPGKTKDGQLVHISGKVAVGDAPSDPVFALSVPGAMKITRKVEVYQWVEIKKTESKKKAGGKKVKKTTYNYEMKWSDKIVDSSKFKIKKGHMNVRTKKVAEDKTFTAKNITIGKFTLTPEQASGLGSLKKFELTDKDLAAMPAKVKGIAKIHDGMLYMGNDPTKARNGDTRITFSVAKPGDATVVGGQKGTGFTSYKGKKMKSALEVMVRDGIMSPDKMFEAAQSDNAALTWGLRIVSLIMLIGGFRMVFGPLSVIADVIPFIGSMVGGATTLLSVLLGGGLWFLAVAVAWVVARPLIGILMLLLAGGMIGGLFFLASKRKGAAPAGPPPGPPPM